MPSVTTIRAGIARLPEGPPLVIALVGGTTGIGSYVARVLATTFKSHGSKLRVYIVGRNATRAETLLKYGRETSFGSDWRFIQASDLSLISDVDRVAKDIIEQEEAAPFAGGPARLDVLYMSQALSPLQESKPSTEGIDTQMSLLYYSRIRFIEQLTPLLTAATVPAHVISIFAGGVEDSINPGKLPIGTPPPEDYGVIAVRKHTTFMKTFLFEEMAEKHAGRIGFIHIFPGLVDGPTFYNDVVPLWARVAWRVLKPLVSWYMTKPELCGEVMLYLATERYPAKGTTEQADINEADGNIAYSTQRQLGGGAYGVGQRGHERKDVSYVKIRKSDTTKIIWDHTMDCLKKAEQSRPSQITVV
ncbi:Nn.00g049440.m01.CDS01 [Neocucurbitaria sp. VM-36]